MKRLAATLVSLVFFIASLAQMPDKAKLDQFFDRLAEKNKAMGSLIITKEGNVLYARSIGYSLISGIEKKPLTETSRFRVGSITKMFTAVMIFQLIEEKKLKLIDKLDKFFPEIPNANKISIAHVLAHRSGIHDVTEDREFRMLRLQGITKNEMVALMAKSAPEFEPDTKYSYSNAGYFLLGMIVEKLTGQSYQENLKEKINSRIGLKDTYLGEGAIDTGKNESFSYKYILDWKQEPETHMSLLFGSGALISTPADLAKFVQGLFDKKLVSEESLHQMMENKLGMEPFPYNGKTFYGHTGGIDGFGSWVVYLPEEKLAVSYATNGKVYPVSNIIDGVFDIYWNKPFTIPSFETMVISPEVLDKYVGIYASPEGPMKFTVTRQNTSLLIEMTGKSPAPLEPVAQDKFKIESVGIVVVFDAVKNQMIIIRNGREKILTKEK